MNPYPPNFQNYPNQYYPSPMYPYPMQKRSIIPLNWHSTLKTAQKTIYTINQVIPVIYQVRPIIHNAKTAFRVIKAVNEMDLSPSFDQEIDQAIHTNTSPEFENML